MGGGGGKGVKGGGDRNGPSFIPECFSPALKASSNFTAFFLCGILFQRVNVLSLLFSRARGGGVKNIKQNCLPGLKRQHKLLAMICGF